jgi:hypothetical protein
MNTMIAEPADAPNPAMTSLFHAGRHWRGVADPGGRGTSVGNADAMGRRRRSVLAFGEKIQVLPCFQ